MKQCQNNPVKLGYKSPGITVDYGLHDHQTRQAMMVSMEICKNVLPPGSKNIRSIPYACHRDAIIKWLPEKENEFFLKGRRRISQTSKGNQGKSLMLPQIRRTSLPSRCDFAAVSTAKFEGICHAAASDISCRYFNSFPGVCALKYVQDTLKWAEDAMLKNGQQCPFAGATDYLYAKGSMSLQETKGWHDDANGPACLTCWQNFGSVEGKHLELCVAIHGCFIRISEGIGKFVHFMGWLPHCTRLINMHENECDYTPFWLHHTAYTKMGTEYAAYILNEYRSRNLGVPATLTK